MGVSLVIALVALSGCKDKKDSSDYLRSGKLLYQQDQLEKARVEFRNALAVDANNAEAHLGLAMVAKTKKDHIAQQFHLHKAAELNPDNAEAQFARGELAVLSGDLTGAEESAAALLRLQPQSHEYYQLASAVAIAQQDWTQATALIDDGLKAYTDNAELWGLRGVVAKKNKRWPAALAALDKAIALNPQDLQYRLLRMEVNQMRGDFDATVADLTELIASSSDPQAQIVQLIKLIHDRDGVDAALVQLTGYIDEYPQAYALQTLHVDLVKPADAQQAGILLDRYIRQASDPSGLLFYRVYAALENDHAALAKQDLKAILDTSMTDRAQVEAKALLAELAWLEQDYLGADKLIADVLAFNSGHERALLLKAKLLTQSGRADEAVVYLNKLLSKDSGSVGALELLASYYQSQGKSGIAADFYNRILQYDSAHYQALQFKIAEDFSKGHLTNTDASLARALQSYPNDVSLISVKLQVAAMRSRFKEADALLQRLAEMNVNKADISFYKGFIAQRQKQHVQAMTYFAEALSSRGSFDKALDAMHESARAASRESDFQRFLQKRVQTAPSDLSAQLMLARLLSVTDFDSAIDHLQKARVKHPEWLAGTVALAELYTYGGRLDDAFELLESTYKSTGDARAGVAYAQHLQLRGSFVEAGSVYEQLLQGQPNDVVARNNYAGLLVGPLYSPQAARKALQLSESFAASDNPSLLDTYGTALAKSGKHSEAIHTFKKALSIADVPAIRLHYAQALYYGGKQQAAQEMLVALEQNLDAERDKRLLDELDLFRNSIK